MFTGSRSGLQPWDQGWSHIDDIFGVWVPPKENKTEKKGHNSNKF